MKPIRPKELAEQSKSLAKCTQMNLISTGWQISTAVRTIHFAHYEETADEILDQVPDVTHFVAGIGTFGTLRGAGARLREAVGARVIGIEPVLGQSIQGLRNMNEPNPPSLYDESLLDEKLMAMADTAYSTTRLLAEKEGLFVGMSSGAAMHGALQLAETMEEGVIVVLFPDRGEKYLSTTLFDAPKAVAAGSIEDSEQDSCLAPGVEFQI